MEPLLLEKKLITLLGNFTGEEVHFLKHIQPALEVCKEEANLNNEAELLHYLATESFKTFAIEDYCKSKQGFPWEHYLKNKISELSTEITNSKGNILSLEQIIQDKCTEFKKLNAYNQQYNSDYYLIEKEKIESKIKRFEETVKTNLLFYKKYQNLISLKIDINQFDFNANKRALNTISLITQRRNFSYYLSTNLYKTEITTNVYKTYSSLEESVTSDLISFDAISKKLKPYFKASPNVIPSNWKSYINFCINNSNSAFESSFTKTEFFTEQSFPVTPFDYSFLIALRNNLIQKEFITADNIIFLPLSGGIMAEIIFKEYKKEKNDVLFYVNGVVNQSDQFYSKNKNILYSIDGYSDGSVNIETPQGYLFLAENLYCDITFHAAPILFENNTIQRISNSLPADAEKFDADNDDSDDEYYHSRRKR